MATNFKLTRGESKKDDDSHYVVQKEWQKEREHVMKIEKELKAHEKTDISHAHPRHSPSATAHRQSQAPLPNMRKG